MAGGPPAGGRAAPGQRRPVRGRAFAVIDAAAQHARNESEVGGYVAAEAAAPALDAGRVAFAALAGMPDAEVVFTTGSLNALDLLLGGWPAERRRVACLPGEYGPNLALLAVHGFDRPAAADARGSAGSRSTTRRWHWMPTRPIWST